MTDSNVDISEVGDLADVIAGGGDDYQAPSGFAKPPDSGEYTFMRVAENDSDYSEYEGKNDKGSYWGANFKVVIQGGVFDGRAGRFGVNTFPAFDRIGTTAGDFLRASKSAERPTTVGGMKVAVGKTFGPFNAVTGWEWRCRDCDNGNFLVGQFGPKQPKKYLKDVGAILKPLLVDVKVGDKIVKQASHVQKCPTCSQEVGANMSVKRFVVPQSGAVAGPAPVRQTAEVAG